MAGGAGALGRIAETHGVQMHRVANPERAEHEHVVAARDGLAHAVARVGRRIIVVRQLLPLLAQRNHVVGDVVAEQPVTARGEVAHAETRRTVRLP